MKFICISIPVNVMRNKMKLSVAMDINNGSGGHKYIMRIETAYEIKICRQGRFDRYCLSLWGYQNLYVHCCI